MKKYVVSSTLTDPEWNNTDVIGLDDVAAIRDSEGGSIQVAGSPSLAQGLHRAGLVDQWNLMVFPVILGSGKRLFPTDVEDKQKLKLVDSRPTPTASSCRSSAAPDDLEPVLVRW